MAKRATRSSMSAIESKERVVSEDWRGLVRTSVLTTPTAAFGGWLNLHHEWYGGRVSVSVVHNFDRPLMTQAAQDRHK